MPTRKAFAVRVQLGQGRSATRLSLKKALRSERAHEALKGFEGKRLTYKMPLEKKLRKLTRPKLRIRVAVVWGGQDLHPHEF